MTTTLNPPEQRILLNNISWELYESLLTAHLASSVPRFTYDRGCLEIMSPSDEHEQLTRAFDQLVNIVAEEINVNAKGYGSTTFRRRDLKRGFEPDACFYSQNLHRVLGKKTKIDLRTDPPPDLVIEIDVTSSSLNKAAIMAEFGVPELWRHRRNVCHILGLESTGYVERPESSMLPGLTAELISVLIEESRTLEPLIWIRHVRAAVK